MILARIDDAGDRPLVTTVTAVTSCFARFSDRVTSVPCASENETFQRGSSARDTGYSAAGDATVAVCILVRDLFPWVHHP